MIQIEGPNGVICRPLEIDDYEPLYDTLRVWPAHAAGRGPMSPESVRRCLSRWIKQNDELLAQGLPFTRSSWGWLTMCAEDGDGPLGFTRTNIVGKDHGRAKVDASNRGVMPNDEGGRPELPEAPHEWAPMWLDRGVVEADLVISSYYPTSFETGFISMHPEARQQGHWHLVDMLQTRWAFDHAGVDDVIGEIDMTSGAMASRLDTRYEDRQIERSGRDRNFRQVKMDRARWERESAAEARDLVVFIVEPRARRRRRRQ